MKQDLLQRDILYNSDLIDLEKRNNFSIKEASLLSLKNAKESAIQTYCNNLTTKFKQKFNQDYPNLPIELEFVQIDNGGNHTLGGKIKKWREGTKRGFPDVMLLFSLDHLTEVLFVEFKRIGIKSSINISEHQNLWHKKLEKMGFQAFITNNPFFFEEEILKNRIEQKIKQWIKLNV